LIELLGLDSIDPLDENRNFVQRKTDKAHEGRSMESRNADSGMLNKDVIVSGFK
jgi:hypothetical protein